MRKNGFGGTFVLGVDPGLEGAFVLTDGREFLECLEMPVKKFANDRLVSFQGVGAALRQLCGHGPYTNFQTYIERAKPLAMGSRHAFNYGRSYEALLLAIAEAGIEPILVEPSAWTKIMHEGTPKELRAKARSALAARERFPQLVRRLPRRPRSGDVKDGPLDALLIAGFGLWELTRDFY